MTTIIPFLPSNIFPPTFQVTFDGASFKIVVSFNVAAQRYYINVYGLDNTWIITVPLIQTPPARAVEVISYDNLRRVVNVQLVNPSQWAVPLSSAGTNMAPGTMADYTFENFTPDVYNGRFRCLHINDQNIEFPMADDPGEALILGSISRHLSMVEGIFTSTFIYRNGAFEVSP
jgi:hypothetical protein